MGNFKSTGKFLNEEEMDKWNSGQVEQWLEEKGFSRYKSKSHINRLVLHLHRDDDAVVAIVQQKRLTGKALRSMDSEDKLKELGVDESDVPKLFKEITDLIAKVVVATATDSERVDMVMKKFVKMYGPQTLESAMHKTTARNLSVKQHTLNTYLNENNVATANLVNDLINDTSIDQHPTDNSGGSTFASPFSSKSESQNTNNPTDNSQNMERMLEQFKEADPQMPEKFMKVKLVVVEIHKTNTQRRVRHLLSPIMDSIGLSQKFGLFHTALILGPWYLEWNDSSLIVPRKCFSGASFLAADVGVTFKGDATVQNIIDKTAEVICNWNAFKQYSQTNCNCQTFVDELCTELGINLQFSGALGDYLNRVRRDGASDVSFPISEELRKILKTQEKTKKFSTHQELDDFITTIEQADHTYLRNNPDDRSLLKSFDRAFWLRYLKDPDNKKMQPHHVSPNSHLTSCPFKHPIETFSMAQ